VPYVLAIALPRPAGTLPGAAGGTVIASPGWASARSRLDTDATAGVSRLLVAGYPGGS
jgi:hypothetical protein